MKVGGNMNRIKELRQSRGLTLKQLSTELKEQSGVSISDGQLSNYENEKRSPRNQDTWKKMADFFDVSVGYLMGLTNLNRMNLPNDPYENLQKSTSYDYYYNSLENAFNLLSGALISPLSNDVSNESISEAIESYAVGYDLLLRQHGPQKAKIYSDVISLVNELALPYTNNKMHKSQLSNDELDLKIQQSKDKLLSMISTLIESDKNFYTGDSVKNHKEFYSDSFENNN